MRMRCAATLDNFNPLPPRGGRRHTVILPPLWRQFQSTPSARRETEEVAEKLKQSTFQSTPSARRETTDSPCLFFHFLLFQSTPSARRETNFDNSTRVTSVISIHSLREEGDMGCGIFCIGICYFNPLPPRGGRRELDGLSLRI